MVEAYHAATELGLDRIFQVGDFGYWPRKAGPGGESDYLFTVNRLGSETGIPCYWLPGNHEDWLSYEELFQGPMDDEGFAVHGWMRATPRVHRWTWDNLKFGSIGGAFSIDRSMRKEGWSWFYQEVPTWQDAEALGDDPLDVLLTHDGPVNVATEILGKRSIDFGVEAGEAAQSQAVIAQAMLNTRPSITFHGHWHCRTFYKYQGMKVQLLDMASGNPTVQAGAVLDTVKRRWYSLNEFAYEQEGTEIP
jgi:hypothetical protein